MPESHRTTLFFIASPQFALTSVENFLRKRGYDVYIETDIKTGLIQVLKVQPDFVFIALDQGNHKIELLPQIIEQYLETHIVLFTHSNTRETIHKLDDSAYIHKIFPPLSGPAIERMTIKLNAEITPTDNGKRPVRGSKPIDNVDAIVNGFLTQLTENHKVKTEERKADKTKTQFLKAKNLFFANSQKNKISDTHKESLKKNFNASIKSDLTDILETCQHETDASNVVTLKEKKTVYCLLVQSKDWSGHLMAYSNTKLERHMLDPVFKNWISKEFQYFDEQDNPVFFEIEIDPCDFQIWVENKAEYHETVKASDSELYLNFVGIEPNHLLVDFDEENDLIDVQLSWVPLQTDLNLSLYLHLPENKKFLLYTPLKQQMNEMQKQRLIENRVDKLFSPVEFEDEVKRLKMIDYFESLFSALRTEPTE